MSTIPDTSPTIRTEISIKRSRFIATVGHAETVEAARVYSADSALKCRMRRTCVCVSRGLWQQRQGRLVGRRRAGWYSVNPQWRYYAVRTLGISRWLLPAISAIKLAGGFSRAYSSRQRSARYSSSHRRKSQLISMEIPVPYAHYEQVKRLLPDYQAIILDEIFAKDVTVKLSIPQDLFNPFSAHIREFTLGNIAPILTSES